MAGSIILTFVCNSICEDVHVYADVLRRWLQTNPVCYFQAMYYLS